MDIDKTKASTIWTKAKGLAFLKIFLRSGARANIKQSILPYWISAIHEILKLSDTCNCEINCWLQEHNDEEKIEWVKRNWSTELSFETFWREVVAMYMTAVYFKQVRARQKQSLAN